MKEQNLLNPGLCQVTTTDQATAVVSKEREPLRTLQTFRKGSLLGWTRVPQWKAGVFFGEACGPTFKDLCNLGRLERVRAGGFETCHAFMVTLKSCFCWILR